MDILETELKFAVEPGATVPNLTSARFGRSEEFTMHAQYFDTPDFVLTRSKAATVRRRVGGPDEGWHVKLSTGNDARLRRESNVLAHKTSPIEGVADSSDEPSLSAESRIEVHAPLDSPLIPGDLRARVAGIVGTAPLVPVALLITRRTETELVTSDGEVLGKLCHDEVSADAQGHLTSWAELEVETVAPDPGWLESVTTEFAAAGIPVARHASKYGKAMEPILSSSAVTATAGTVVLGYVCAEVGVLQAYADKARTDVPDAVHRSRVATRRLRAILRTYADVLAPGEPLRHELTWHAAKLGAARDAEVLMASLSTLLDGLPQVPGPMARRLSSSLSESHAQAHAELVASMDGSRYVDLCLRLIDLIVTPPFTAASESVPEALLQNAHEAALRTITAAKDASETSDLAAWHRVRKLAKTARYSYEALVEQFGEQARQSAKCWEAVTEALGRAQDARIGQDFLRELATEAARAGEPVSTYEELCTKLAADGTVALHDAQSAISTAATL